MRTIGADVSHWEGAIDWQEAARWLPFVYYKCTDGERNVDPTFKANKAGCQATGMPHAAFHWLQPDQDPIKQADHFVDIAGDGYGRYIADVEQKPVNSKNFVQNVLAFLLQVEKRTASKPAIYTSPGFWNENMKPKPAWAKDYDLIVAHYTIDHTPTLPIGWDKYAIWQFTDSYFFPGCQCQADGDWFNGSLAQMRAWFGNYRPIDLPGEPAEPGLQLKSLFNGLHIRQQPNKLAKELGHLTRNEKVQLEALGGQDVWIKHSRGWTAVEINGYRYMEIVT